MTRDQLIASLQIAGSDFYLDLPDGTIDFTEKDGGRRCFEFSADGDTTTMWLDREQVEALHQKLTVLLLREAV